MTDDPRDDDRLLDAARAGDRAALESLLARHQARIYRFSLKMCRDPEDASDVLQETLIALARSVHGLRGQSALSTWLYTVARSHCIKKRRRSTFAPVPTESLDGGPATTVADPVPGPEESLAARELERALNVALGGLPEDQREVVLLRDGEGLTAPEVAEVLGISSEAVKSRLHRGRLALRELLGPILGPVARPPAGRTACPDVLVTYSQFLEGEIGAEMCRQMEKHLAGCRHCTEVCDSLKRSLAICSTSPASAVPPQVQAAVRRAVDDALMQSKP